MALCTALLVAVLLRVSVYNDFYDTPALSLGKNVESDMAFFWDWSDELRRDPLQNRNLHPLHSWHREIADRTFLAHPEKLGESTDDTGSDPRRRLWDGWYGEKRYHQEPLYAYLLAAIRSLSGDDAFWVYVVQMGFGLVTLVLLHRVTERAFGAAAAAAALAMGTLCAPLLYYEFFLLRASLNTFATLLLVWLAQRIDAAPTTRRFAAFGLVLGLATTLKVSFLLFGGLAIAWLALPKRPDALLKKCAAFALGCSMVLSAVVVRNAIVGAPILGFTSVGAVTFAGTNYNGYLPVAGWFVEPDVMSRILFESDGGFVGTVAATVGTHDSILSVARLWVDKALQVFHWREISNNTNLYYDFLHSPTLAWLPVGFGFVAPLALWGFVVCVRRRVGGLVSAQALLTLAPLIGFYVLSRLRAPFLVALMPLAGLGAASAWELLRQKRFAFVGLLGVALVAIASFIQRDSAPVVRSGVTLEATHVVSGRAFEAARTVFYGPEIREALESGDLDRASELSEQEIATRPSWLDEVSPDRPPRNDYQAGVVNAFVPVYSDAAVIALRSEDEAKTGRYARRYKELRRAHRIVEQKK